MGRYLLDDFSENEETLYKGIYRLPPAHSLSLRGKEIKKKQYWDIDPSRVIRYKRDEEYTQHFFELFRESVKSSLRSSTPVGAWLSGGLDSSSVVCMAQKLYAEGAIKNNGFETFSIVFEELPCDEKSYIQPVIDQWELTANLYVYEKNADSANIDKVRGSPDVLYDPTLFMFEPALIAAKRKGVKVMLSGIGGDDVLAAGFHHLADLLRRFRIRHLLSQIRADAKGYERRSTDLFLYSAVLPIIPRPIKKALRGLLKPFRQDSVPAWVSKGFLKEPGIKQYINRRPTRHGFSTYSQEQIYNCLRFEWNPTISLPAMDLFISRFNMETRYPFFDRRLIEYLIAIPEEQRWVGDQPKSILRNAMRGILPEIVRTRTTKADFDPVLDLELKVRQKEKLMRLIEPSILTTLGIVDDKLVRNIFEQYCLGDSRYRAALSVIIRLELWCRAEFEQPQSRYVS
jgi:asparagine synthase (glutamine-hydrolysing)